MKTPEEFIDFYYKGINGFDRLTMLAMMNGYAAVVSKESWNNAIKKACHTCADSATTMIDPNSYCGNTGSEYEPDIIVNRKSIIAVADKLKK